MEVPWHEPADRRVPLGHTVTLAPLSPTYLINRITATTRTRLGLAGGFLTDELGSASLHAAGDQLCFLLTNAERSASLTLAVRGLNPSTPPQSVSSTSHRRHPMRVYASGKPAPDHPEPGHLNHEHARRVGTFGVPPAGTASYGQPAIVPKRRPCASAVTPPS
jgi:hypothetical protein